MNHKKIVNICLIIAASFLYYVASQFAEQVFGWLKVPINQEFWVTYPQMIGVGIGLLGYGIAVTNKTVMVFLAEVVGELSKVTYPTRKESLQSAWVVTIIVAIATVFVAVFDRVWMFVTRLILVS